MLYEVITTRADLFALYYIADPKLLELGLVPSPESGKAEYDAYLRNGLITQLTRIQPGKDLEESHMRNRQLIARWAYEQGKAANVVITSYSIHYTKLYEKSMIREYSVCSILPN